MSRGQEHDSEQPDDDTKVEPAQTDHPTGDEQAEANAEDEPAG